MKTGTIVYLADAKAAAGDLDVETAARAGGLAPEWTRLAASAPGFDGVSEALLDLVRKGAGRVELVAAQRAPQDGLCLADRRLRVYG